MSVGGLPLLRVPIAQAKECWLGELTSEGFSMYDGVILVAA